MSGMKEWKRKWRLLYIGLYRFRVWGLGFWGLGFRDLGLGFTVLGLGVGTTTRIPSFVPCVPSQPQARHGPRKT